jgi:hypothetical protein
MRPRLPSGFRMPGRSIHVQWVVQLKRRQPRWYSVGPERILWIRLADIGLTG